jgi:hypothetical protein
MLRMPKVLVVCSVALPLILLFPQSRTHADQKSVKLSAAVHKKFDWIVSTIDLSAGLRRDKLSWSIAGDSQGNNPNILSELIWSGLEIYQIKLSNHTVIEDRLYARFAVDYGTVTSGSNQDTDYLGDNRTEEFSRSVNSVDGNKVWDASIGMGPRFTFLQSAIAVCPLLGYAISKQDLNIVDGYQAFTAPPANMPVGPFAGLDSSYQTRWKGPWVGVDLLFSIPCTKGLFSFVNITLTGEYHWLDYDADANWNLRSEYAHPVSFSHDAKGHGFVGGVAILFATNNRWGITLGMNMTDMKTDPGVDRTYFADGTTTDTRLNPVHWQSWTVETGFSYQFK